MFTDLFLNPNIYNKEQRKEKIKELCSNNILLKNNFNGFKYTFFNKDQLFNPKNIPRLNDYISNIKIPIYEILGYNTPTKIYLDCEMEDLPQNLYNDKNKIILEFNNYLLKFLNKLYPNNNIQLLYSDASRYKSDNIYKLSLHIVVNNLGYFNNRKKLKTLISNFSKQLPKDIFYRNGKGFVDHEVYHASQLLRIIFSPNKYTDSILKPFIIENNEIIYKDINYISNNYSMSLCGNYKKVDKCLDDTIELCFDKKTQDKKKLIEFKEINTKIPDWKIKWIENNIFVKNIYKIDNINKNKINLKRIKSEYCKICERNHENDNAFCIVYDNNIMFHCNRCQKGKSIGSWFNDKNNGIGINNSIHEIDLLKKENSKLKDEIIQLKNELINYKNISTYKLSKNTTKKNCGNNNLLIKYYEASKYIINNDLESFKNIITQNWKDKNLSKLKNRCLRIYDLLEYMKNNNFSNIKCPLRNIFNIPNWKFNEELKKNNFFL